MSRFDVFLFLTLFSTSLARANIILPTGLTNDDRTQITKTLGWGGSSKLLSEPYPLGGYSGLEIGVSVESIPISQFAYLGNGTPPQQNFTFPKINIGKGLFKDIDFFVHFIPFSEDTNISEFGGLLRWGFYQTQFLPANFSILLHGNSSNISNMIVCESYGADLVSGLTFPTFSFYIGGGAISSRANFMLPDTDGEVLSSTATGLRTFLGGVFHFTDFFASFEVDQYDDTVFSTKVGVRY